MASFTYHGPKQTIPLKTSTKKDSDGKTVSVFKEFEFAPGKDISGLPEDNRIIKSMIASKTLLPVADKQAAKKSTKSAETKND